MLAQLTAQVELLEKQQAEGARRKKSKSKGQGRKDAVKARANRTGSACRQETVTWEMMR